jgi:hypothetical protein
MTTLAVLQPSYIPWLGFFDQILNSDVFILLDNVQYDKNGWRNRNRIKTDMGVMWLTVPIKSSGQFQQKIAEVKICYDKNWINKHIRALENQYSHSEYLSFYLPKLEEILNEKHEMLVDLNYKIIQQCCDWLNIDTKIVRASDLHIAGEKNNKLLSICKIFGANKYLSGDSAKNYLDSNLFINNGIEVIWHNYNHPSYFQRHGDFISHLSIIDLLLNCGTSSKKIIRKIN